MPGPRIDIMLPYYGDVALMQDAVRSVLAQDTGGWRLTVVDDTADTSESTVPAWFEALGDDRVRYYRNPANLGITANFQRCLDLAEHERTVLLGADDLLLPGYVRAVLAVDAEHPGAGMIQPGVQVIDEEGRPAASLADRVKRRLYAPRGRQVPARRVPGRRVPGRRVPGRRVLSGEQLAASLLRGNWLYFPSICWRTDAIAAVGFRPELRTTQDLAVELELVERGERLVLDDTVCFRYRRHSASVSSRMAVDGDRFREEQAVFTEAARRLAARGWARAARAARTHSSSRLHALTKVPGAVRAGQRAVAGELVRHAFRSI